MSYLEPVNILFLTLCLLDRQKQRKNFFTDAFIHILHKIVKISVVSVKDFPYYYHDLEAWGELRDCVSQSTTRKSETTQSI